MGEAFHRALMAFPDEDVVVGTRFVAPDGVEALRAADRHHPPARPPGRRRGAGVGSPPGQALRRGLAPTTSRASSCSPTASPASSTTRPSSRRRSTPTSRPCSGASTGQGRVAHRLRLDDGRGPAQAGLPRLTEAEPVVPGPLPPTLRRRRPPPAHDRAFDPGRPVPAALLDGLVDLAGRAPSAGKAQGWHLVVLEGADTARFWDVTLPPERRSGFAWPGLLDAAGHRAAPGRPRGLRAPATASRTRRRPGSAGRRAAWPVPYWTVDAAFAVMTLLLAAEDAGLGALFFGVFQGRRSCAAALGAPRPTSSCWAPSPSGWPADGGPGRPGPLSRPPAACPGGDHPPGRLVRLRSRPGCRTSPAGRCSPAGWRR